MNPVTVFGSKERFSLLPRAVQIVQCSAALRACRSLRAEFNTRRLLSLRYARPHPAHLVVPTRPPHFLNTAIFSAFSCDIFHRVLM